MVHMHLAHRFRRYAARAAGIRRWLPSVDFAISLGPFLRRHWSQQTARPVRPTRAKAAGGAAEAPILSGECHCWLVVQQCAFQRRYHELGKPRTRGKLRICTLLDGERTSNSKTGFLIACLQLRGPSTSAILHCWSSQQCHTPSTLTPPQSPSSPRASAVRSSDPHARATGTPHVRPGIRARKSAAPWSGAMRPTCCPSSCAAFCCGGT